MQSTTTTDSANTEETPDIKDVSQARVLVVDDDPAIRLVTSKILEHAGFKYYCASSAIEALNCIHEIQPELILSDITMPGIDGLEFCERIRADEKLKNIPLIFFTSHSKSETLATAFEAGANDYLIKPLRPFEVASRVQHHIIRYRLHRADHEQIAILDTKHQTMSKFLSVASHDLRNPLVSIRGISKYLEAEKFGPLNEEQTELVSTIQQTSIAMLNLVDDLLEISKFKATLQEIIPKPEKLESILTLATTLHSVYASQKKIAMDFEHEGESIVAPIDRKLITRVCDNLISNAIKFSPSDTKITLTLYQKNNHAYISVTDQGPGIPTDQFDKLFKEFSRTSVQPTAGENSNGLGLYLCKSIVEGHGGTISAQNHDEGGARFLVELPLQTPDV